MRGVGGFLIMLAIMVMSDDTLLFGTNENQAFVAVRSVLYLLLIIALCCVPRQQLARGESRSGSLALAAVLLLAFAVPMVVKLDLRPGYLIEATVLVLAIQIARKRDLGALVRHYLSFLTFFACASLLVFGLSVLVPGVMAMLPTTVNYGGVEFANLLVGVAFRDTDVMRNTGIFREPGVFALYLLVGILFELHLVRRPSGARLLLFIVTLVTTFSTAGFMILAVLLLASFARQKGSSLGFWALALVVALAAVLAFMPQAFLSLFAKFDEGSVDYASALARLSSISVPFLIFLSAPLSGVGLSGFVDAYFAYSQMLFGFPISPEGSSTNTLINTFAIFGLLFGTLVTAGVARFAALLAPTRTVAVLLFLALVMMLSAQELRFSLLFNVLIMFGLFYRTPTTRTTSP